MILPWVCVEKLEETNFEYHKDRGEYLRNMEKYLPNDYQLLKGFAIEFILANQLFQERCKQAIYQVIKEKHEINYKRKMLEDSAGIVDGDASAAFLDNLQKIEEENETQAATIARLKILNHSLERTAQHRADNYRKNLNEISEKHEKNVKAQVNTILEKENEFLVDWNNLTTELADKKRRLYELVSGKLQERSITLREADFQFLNSIINDNVYLEKNISDVEVDILLLNERLRTAETIKTACDKDLSKTKQDLNILRRNVYEAMTRAFTEARTEADDREEESGHILFVKGENGRNIVKSATLEKLLDRLTDPSTFDVQFQTTFFLTYHSYTDSQTVLAHMMRRYKDSMITNTSNPSSGSASNPARQRICQSIKDWIELCRYDFTEDKMLLTRVLEFADYVNKHNAKNGALIKTALSVKTTSPLIPAQQDPKDASKDGNPSTPAKDTNLPRPILPKGRRANSETSDELISPMPRLERLSSIFGKQKEKIEERGELKFQDVDPLEFARQITLIESDLFSKIKPTEFLDQSWAKEEKLIKATNICEMIQWSYHVTQWLISEIILSKDTKARVAVYEKIVQLAQHLDQLHNFNGVKEVLLAVQSPIIKALNKMKELVSPKFIKILEDLERATSSDMNFKHLRSKIHNSALPLIPYPGIYQSDLAAIDNGSKNILDNRMINFSKYIRLASYIQELQVYQQASYILETVPEIADYIKNFDILSEADAIRQATVLQ